MAEIAAEDSWRGIDARDRSTWPAELLKHVPDMSWDMEIADHLGHYRENVLVQLVTERLGDAFAFCVAATHYLLERARQADNPEWLLLDQLASWQYGLVQEAVAHALDLAPMVNEVMPFKSGAGFLAAMRAQFALSEEESPDRTPESNMPVVVESGVPVQAESNGDLLAAIPNVKDRDFVRRWNAGENSVSLARRFGLADAHAVGNKAYELRKVFSDLVKSRRNQGNWSDDDE